MYISLRDYSRHIWKHQDIIDIYEFSVKLPITIHEVLYVEITYNHNYTKEVLEFYKEKDIEVLEV